MYIPDEAISVMIMCAIYSVLFNIDIWMKSKTAGDEVTKKMNSK